MIAGSNSPMPQPYPGRLARRSLALCLLLSGHAFAAAPTAHSLVGTVKYQRPGMDGNPSAAAWFLNLLVNRPRSLSDRDELHDRDGLLGETEDSAVQLVCANGATVTLSGKFDAYLKLGSNDQGCTVFVRAGTVVATTASTDNSGGIPTIIQYGNITLGALSTQFGATIQSDQFAKPENVQADAFVVEGVVNVQRSAPGTGSLEQIVQLQTGQQLLPQQTTAVALTDDKFNALATTYARLESKSAPEAQRAIVQQELQVAYARSLRQPTDAQAQRALMQVYQTRSLQASPVAKYKQFQINKINPAALTVSPNLSGQ